MSPSSKSSDEKPRPFSLRPQDFGAPERVAKSETQAEEEAEAPPPISYRDPDQAPTGSAGRASTHSRRPEADDSVNVKPKEDHTILMAVPPPAQENTGD